jgi:hypothetical protein
MDLERQQADEARAEAASEHAPVVHAMRSIFPDTSPAESAKWFGQVASNFRQDPVGTLAWLGSQTGMSPVQVAQAIYQRFGNQQPQQQYQQQDYSPDQIQAVDAMIRDFAEKNPRLEDLECEVIEILQTPTFQQSGQRPDIKLKAALDLAEKRDKGGDFDAKMERSMQRVAKKRGIA